MVCYWSQQGNAVFNALAMKCFQLCFMARAKAVKRPEHGLQYGQNRSLLDSWSGALPDWQTAGLALIPL
jgi:hypothetical protein